MTEDEPIANGAIHGEVEILEQPRLEPIVEDDKPFSWL
jgi:hypothetical protein